SVFYVVCYGLVYVYANGRLGNAFWDMSREDPAGYRAMILDKFPRLTKWLFDTSISQVNPGALKVLKDFHEVLFSRVDVENFYLCEGRDPREGYFSEIQADICSKFGLNPAALDLSSSSTLEGPNAIH
ncbi:hypothetical protein EV182_008871, partial [Spiromyces aspiralis]